MTIHKDTTQLGRATKDLSAREGSPCIDCLVTSSCTRSFINHSACQEFAEFIQDILSKAGAEGKIYEDKN